MIMTPGTAAKRAKGRVRAEYADVAQAFSMTASPIARCLLRIRLFHLRYDYLQAGGDLLEVPLPRGCDAATTVVEGRARDRARGTDKGAGQARDASGRVRSAVRGGNRGSVEAGAARAKKRVDPD
jgi:hypothetical protein